jgi:Domain of unknown function (DUF4157)
MDPMRALVQNPKTRQATEPAGRRLFVNSPGDAYEQEADRIAGQVMADQVMPVPAGSPRLQRFSLPSNGEMDAAPASVEQVLAGPGSPLEPGVRQDMEPRFGHDFSRVTVHSGAAAEQSARDVGASAYTVGNHMVFGKGWFAPATSGGRRLIAHELTHVLQQRGGTGAPQLMRAPAPQAPQQAPMQPGTADDRREMAEIAIRFLESQGEFFAQQVDRDTAQVLGHLRTTAENTLTTLAIDPGSAPIADRVRAAYSAAVRTVLVSRTTAQSVQTPPTLQELFEQHRDDILPFALPQAQADTGANELSAELAAALPAGATRDQRTRHAAIQAARQRLQVITSQVDFPLEDLFSTQGGTMGISLTGVTMRLSSTIPAALQPGLRSLAAQLFDTPLTPNTSVMLALDLSPFGGGFDSYRFTRLDLGGTLGTEILIERQGAIGIEGLTREQRTPMRERFDRFGFVRGGGFSEDEFDQVLIGLGEIPDAQLSTLGALRFARSSSDPLHPDAAANYDQTAHTVNVFDKAYGSGMTRMGRAGRSLRYAAHAVIHEVGHALDLSALRTAAATTTAAQDALLAEFGTGGTNYEVPDRRDPRHERFAELNAGVTRATTAERAARSRSGARWTTGATAEVTDALVARARQPAFRQAALLDGGGTRFMPTDYPNPESVWQEYFADSFALFQASPDLLQRTRPHVFAYMAREFPR